jgi:adenylylsulfate kinase
VSKLFADAGVVTLSSFISPYEGPRLLPRDPQGGRHRLLRGLRRHCPLDVCEERDPKGLYKKARAGEIKGFTGIDDPYEAPENPELDLPTHELSVEESVVKLVGMLEDAGVIPKQA